MKIAILSCFYPYRGGIAQFNANIYNQLGKSHQVKAFNFKRQYPSLLFPGKTQYVTDDDNAVQVESTPLLDSVNPLSYITTARIIREWDPDLLLMRYWNSFFAPSQGYVARNQNKRTKIISIADNIIPHERRFFDTPFTRYYLSAMDGVIVMSESVKEDLLNLKPGIKNIVLPHPIYNHFGEKRDKEEAIEQLGLLKGFKNLLFFGLIREYKGLDILIDALSHLDNTYQLIIAGEPYGDFEPYQEQIDNSPAKERIKLFNRYIPDSEVPLFFSSADLVVLPYRSATQSGISAICYNFEIPMVTTDVGGLKESVGERGTGIVVDKPDGREIARGINSFFTEGKKESYINNIIKEREALSWETFTQKLIHFYKTL